ncbi:hypothetical protein [Sodalis-like endosymbiont of Proechinophthirus fluctus]|nr:hypothetical protein [Sodalis-like endosymbiont of Proechinophthirus fluctus]
MRRNLWSRGVAVPLTDEAVVIQMANYIEFSLAACIFRRHQTRDASRQ